VHFVLGSWYRSHEIGRRGGIFYIGLPLGYLTASLLQTAALEYLDGINGLAGWRWLFIINAVITLPLAVAGYFIWPGTIAKPNRLLIKQHELEIARERLQKDGVQVKSGASSPSNLFSWDLIKSLFFKPRFWLIMIWDSFFFVAEASTSSFLLWLDSLGRYSSAEVNRLNAIGPGLGIFFILFINFSSDLWLGRTGAITLTLAVSFTGLVMLAIWDVPEGAKWFAYSTQFSASAVSSVLYGWINVIYRDNTEERAAVIVLVTTVATAWTAWIPLFTYPTSEGPRFVHGYAFSATITVLLVMMTFVIRYLYGEDGYESSLETVSE
jgi:Major Facilitator Superfamily